MEDNKANNQNDSEHYRNAVNTILQSIDVTRITEAIFGFINNKSAERDKLNAERTKEVHSFEKKRLWFYVGFVAFLLCVICFLAYNRLISDTVTASLLSLIIGYSIGSNQKNRT